MDDNKTFEVRKNDRKFNVGDRLELAEYDSETECYTGRVVFAEIIYILHGGGFGIAQGYCVMSIKLEG